ncbi:hypothetical protein ACWDSJ_24470 [Nocardia sp. NPDC003482]
MNDFRSLADRVEIDALRAAFPDAVMMRDFARLATLFTDDGVLCIPDAISNGRLPSQLRDLPRPLPSHDGGLEVQRAQV